MKILIIVGVLLILGTIYVLTTLNSKNRFNFLNIKIKEADSNINLYLQKKKTTLNNIIKIIIDEKQDDGKFDDFDNLVKKPKDSFELHSTLNKYYSILSNLLLENEELSRNEDIVNHLVNLKSNEEDLIGSIKFYNDTIVDYNGLVNAFPHKVYARMHSFNTKDFYKNEKEELFDILK